MNLLYGILLHFTVSSDLGDTYFKRMCAGGPNGPLLEFATEEEAREHAERVGPYTQAYAFSVIKLLSRPAAPGSEVLVVIRKYADEGSRFHQSLVAFHAERGYLTPKQIAAGTKPPLKAYPPPLYPEDLGLDGPGDDPMCWDDMYDSE